MNLVCVLSALFVAAASLGAGVACAGEPAAQVPVPTPIGAGPAEGPKAAEQPEKTSLPFRYSGRALYLSVGSGVVADLARPTFDTRLLATFPVARWAMIEAFVLATDFGATGPQGKEANSLGLGFGVGFRVATVPDRWFRPHLALRGEHVHLTPDLWGTPSSTDASDPSANTSLHRWGASLAAGFDVPLFASSERWRGTFEVVGTALSGPAANVFVTAYLGLGVAL